MLLIIDERGSKIDKNSVFDCHLSPNWRQIANEHTVFVAQLATNGSRKHCFLSIFCLRSSLALPFSIAAYPVWLVCVVVQVGLSLVQLKTPKFGQNKFFSRQGPYYTLLPTCVWRHQDNPFLCTNSRHKIYGSKEVSCLARLESITCTPPLS